MLYYFQSNVILLLKGSQGTSPEKSINFVGEKLRKFFGEIKKLPKPSQGSSGKKSRQFPSQANQFQERNPINLQSNPNLFASAVPLLRGGNIHSFACFGGKNRVGEEVEGTLPSVGRRGEFVHLRRNVLVKG